MNIGPGEGILIAGFDIEKFQPDFLLCSSIIFNRNNYTKLNGHYYEAAVPIGCKAILMHFGKIDFSELAYGSDHLTKFFDLSYESLMEFLASCKFPEYDHDFIQNCVASWSPGLFFPNNKNNGLGSGDFKDRLVLIQQRQRLTTIQLQTELYKSQSEYNLLRSQMDQISAITNKAATQAC